jgi:AcrR family transcriptional regulator
MVRTYTLKKRAEQQAETKKRIVEAAVELHSTLGPAATTFSMIAEKAGVQRHTLYAHFPDERSIFMACSGLAYERDPMPAADAWGGIADLTARRTVGLTEIYEWYGRNEQLLSNVMRDVAHHPLVQEIQRLRTAPVVKAWHEVLGAELAATQRPMLHLALSFYTWRSLVCESGLDTAAAVDAMVAAIKRAYLDRRE